MNHLCQLLGHDFGEWRWAYGWGNRSRMENGVTHNTGPGHGERRECAREGCGDVEVREILGSKWGGMTDAQLADVHEGIREGRIKSW